VFHLPLTIGRNGPSFPGKCYHFWSLKKDDGTIFAKQNEYKQRVCKPQQKSPEAALAGLSQDGKLVMYDPQRLI